MVDAALYTTTSGNQEFRDKKWSSVSLKAEKKPVVKVEWIIQSGLKHFMLS